MATLHLPGNDTLWYSHTNAQSSLKETTDRHRHAVSHRTDMSAAPGASPHAGAQSSGDTYAPEHHPTIQEDASTLSSEQGRALQAELLRLEEVVPWDAVLRRWRTQRTRWRRALHSPSMSLGAIARSVEEFYGVLDLQPNTYLQTCGASWRLLLRACVHGDVATTEALEAVVHDFQLGVQAWLGRHLEAAPGSPSTPYLLAEGFHPHAKGEHLALQAPYGPRATPPPSPFSMVQPPDLQPPHQLLGGMQRDDSAKQVRQQLPTGGGALDFDSEETDLEDYE